jgi:hypothetical protein
MSEKIKKDCPCATKTCPNWGRCKPCRKMMAAEGAKPVCEWDIQ